MAEIGPDELRTRLEADDVVVLNMTLAADVPDYLPNFERVRRVNVVQESVAANELSALELGPNNCAVE